jgi:SAM-dependent methyltransferase
MTHSAFPCRSCGGHEISDVLDLGRTPLANALLDEAALANPEACFPLVVVFCRRCSLVQITETVPPEQLFRSYLYFSSFSETMLEHASALAERLIAMRRLGPESLVIEAASNDGYLLKNYLSKGVAVLGIEPATNIAKVAAEKGIRTLPDFFGEEIANRLAGEGQRADVFHAHNVLAHVADLNGFVRGVAAILKPSGIAVIEVPYVRDMIEKLEFDTVYHEHLCYFSLTALDHLFRQNGLTIVDVERIVIHGGSLRIFAAPADAGELPTPRYQALREEEQREGLLAEGYYRDFAARVWNLRDALRAKLGDLKRSGKRIAAYGASAKGSTLLNAFGLGREYLEFVVDRSTYKQGHYTPGTHLPIMSPEHLLEALPEYVLLLTWNFQDEILRQQAEYRARGGRFIVPIPEISIV